MGHDAQPSGVRLTELLAALSLGTDLGMGHPMEHVLRQSFLVLRLAERLGLDASEREVVYYSSLMAWVGCHIDAYEQAKWFGDDLALKHEIRWIDEGKATQGAAFVVRHLGAGKPWVERARLAAGFVGDGRRVLEHITENHWRTADALMERLELSPIVRGSVSQTFERWDGKGGPEGAAGEQIELPSRLVNLADVVEVFHQAGGVEAAVGVAKQRRGTQFDPALVDLFGDHADELFAASATGHPLRRWPSNVPIRVAPAGEPGSVGSRNPQPSLASATYGTTNAGVPMSKRRLSFSDPASTASQPSRSSSRVVTSFASIESPAIGRALRSGAPAGRLRAARWFAKMLLKAFTTLAPASRAANSSAGVCPVSIRAATAPSRPGSKFIVSITVRSANAAAGRSRNRKNGMATTTHSPARAA